MPVLVCLTFGDKLYAEQINEKGVHPHKDFMSTVVKEQLSVSVFVCSSIIIVCVALYYTISIITLYVPVNI